MSEQSFIEFKYILIQRREEILKNISILKKNITSLQNSEANDEADFALINSDSLVDEALYSKLKKEMKEIDLVLNKIENKSYGVCEMCEENIEINRLKLKPHARYCVDCREVIEKTNFININQKAKSFYKVI